MKKNKKISLFLIIFMVSCMLCLLTFFHLDADYFWHIQAGDYMFHHGVLTYDVFSWFVKGKYWMSHEWLFEIILYFFKLLFGNLHVIIFCLFCLLGLFLCLFLPNQKKYLKNIPFTLVYFLFFFLIGLVFIQARPHMLSNVFLAFTIYVLYDLYKKEDSRKIYFLPFISILWANVHGGSSNLPYLLCLLFLFGGIFSFQFHKIEAKRLTSKQIQKYLITMILCMVCVCINIHGVKMFLYPYQNMLNSRMIQNIQEWKATSLGEPYHIVYFLFLLFLIGIILISDKKIDWMDFLLFGFFAFLGLKSIRFWFYTFIAMNYIIFAYVKARPVERGTCLMLGCFSAFLILFFFSQFSSLKSISYTNSLSEEMIQTIQKEHPDRLFNMYDLGGELIYHSIDVFIDGRADLYSDYNYADYLDIIQLKSGYQDKLLQYDFDYFLVTDTCPLYSYLVLEDNQYSLVYHDAHIYFFQKRKELVSSEA